jgi:hypothetical protein
VTNLADRFEAKVDRSGEHHVWLGSKKADGTGTFKVDGKVVTAQRMAWELANGPLAEGDGVKPCADTKSCVRVDHLSLRPGAAPRCVSTASLPTTRQRRRAVRPWRSSPRGPRR